jgi:TrmH family RNA methyltransferase
MEPSFAGVVNMNAELIKQAAAGVGKMALEAGLKHESVLWALSVAKGNEPGLFLAEGLWLNSRAMAYGAEMLTLYVCPELVYSDDWARSVGEMSKHAGEVRIVSERVYNRLGDEKADRGVLSVIRLPRWRLEDIPERECETILVLDGLENPGNTGTLIRTAEGAGASAVILCNRRTGLNNRMLVRSSLCTLLTMPVLEADAGACMAFLERRGCTVYLGKADSAVRYCDVGYARRTAIVVGHEKYGVTAGWMERPHVAVRIPMRGQVDSLNVAVAGGILLYEAMRNR